MIEILVRILAEMSELSMSLGATLAPLMSWSDVASTFSFASSWYTRYAACTIRRLELLINVSTMFLGVADDAKVLHVHTLT